MKITINKKTYEINNLYHIATDGNDENDGLTKNTAFRTLHKAASVCSERDGIKFHPGEYTYTNEETCYYRGSYHRSVIGSKVPIIIFTDKAGTVTLNLNLNGVTDRNSLFLLAQESYVLNLIIKYTNDYVNSQPMYNPLAGYNSYGTIDNCAIICNSPTALTLCHSNENYPMSFINCNFVNLSSWGQYNYSARGKSIDKCVFSSQPPLKSNGGGGTVTMTNSLITDTLTIDTLKNPYKLDGIRIGFIESPTFCLLNEGNFYCISEQYYDSNANLYSPLSSFPNEMPYCDELCDRPSYLNGLRPIDLFDGDIQMIYKDACICSINGIKSTKELVVATGDINKELAQTINSIIVESVKTNNGTLKLAVSIDKGKTWKTYDGAIWVDLSITIPSTEYSIMTTDEKLQWNNARDVIASKGIYTSIFNSIDFNTLTDDNTTPGYLRFAYVLIRPAYTDNVKTTKLNWDFNAKGNMDLMIPGTEYNLSLYEKEAKFTSLIDNELVKVNFLI